jgi:hypothetical protein
MRSRNGTFAVEIGVDKVVSTASSDRFGVLAVELSSR